MEIVLKSARSSIVETAVSKEQALLSSARSLSHGVLMTVKAFRKDGMKGIGKLVIDNARAVVDNSRESISDLLKDLRSDRQTFLKKVSKTLVFSISALLYAGGFDFEGGIPDSDLKLGIGYHRNIVSHTIIAPLFIEFSIRFILNIAKEMVEKGHEGHGGIWKILYDFRKEYSESLVGGLWLGAMLHLLKDSAPLVGKTKPLVGIHGLSMEAHKRILGLNSMLSGMFVWYTIKNGIRKKNENQTENVEGKV